MKVGILGSGDVGRALGHGFVELGHEVKIGTRNSKQEKLQGWLAEHRQAAAGSFAEGAAFGDLLVLATLWTGTENAIKMAGAERFSGKTVIDVTNPLDFSGGVPPRLALGFTDSAGETVQRWLPDAKVVKAFNTIGNAHMFRPQFAEGKPDMFICGNDAQAKSEVTKILGDFGWPVVDIGGIEGARLLEPLAMLWITYGFKTNTWKHAFSLIRN